MKWFVVSIFALQATGALWFAHLATCGESGCCDVCRHSHGQQDLDETAGRPEDPEIVLAPADPCHHASQTCDICKTLLTLRATAVVEPALPAATGVCHNLPPVTNQSLPAGVFSIVDARGPPAIIL